ncbi:HU family DNA-binding protein [Catellatospora methionotrophica]|uniref:HU family DNA-binding protein n=1 Tax=Catellatospora methionotrophica TaxID=121620 RepID=UPI001408E869|nr:HU family DNA-binding protein [Catellatospora methionotrophica]
MCAQNDCYESSSTIREESVNKTELIDAIAAHSTVVDKKTAAAVLEATLTEIQNAVTKGDKVSLTGFGVFEKRARAARMARNPRTGEAVKVKKTSVPAFRPGAGFKETVSVGKVAAPAKKATKSAAKKTAGAAGTRPAASKATAASKTAPAKKTATKSTAKATTAKATTAKATAAKATATKATAKKTTAAKTAPAKKTVTAKATTAAKKTTAKATTAKKAPAKKAAKR